MTTLLLSICIAWYVVSLARLPYILPTPRRGGVAPNVENPTEKKERPINMLPTYGTKPGEPCQVGTKRIVNAHDVIMYYATVPPEDYIKERGVLARQWIMKHGSTSDRGEVSEYYDKYFPDPRGPKDAPTVDAKVFGPVKGPALLKAGDPNNHLGWVGEGTPKDSEETSITEKPFEHSPMAC